MIIFYMHLKFKFLKMYQSIENFKIIFLLENNTIFFLKITLEMLIEVSQQTVLSLMKKKSLLESNVNFL